MSNYQSTLRLCRKRDRRAQLEFYMLFYKSVYNSCLRILGNPQESEEITQETFLKVLDKIDSYDGTNLDSMERILKKIAVNSSIDQYRKRRIRFTDIDETFNYTEEEHENKETEEEYEFKLEAIHRNMQLLPEGYRMIITLHLIEDMEYEEIARQLQISASTVRSQYARARQKLIQLIKENHNYEHFIGRPNQEYTGSIR